MPISLYLASSSLISHNIPPKSPHKKAILIWLIAVSVLASQSTAVLIYSKRNSWGRHLRNTSPSLHRETVRQSSKQALFSTQLLLCLFSLIPVTLEIAVCGWEAWHNLCSIVALLLGITPVRRIQLSCRRKEGPQLLSTEKKPQTEN